MDFEINLIFLIELFFVHDQEVRKLKYLGDKKSF